MQPVSEYNRGADREYRKAVAEWQPSKGGFPFRGFYVFTREDTGEDYQRGYVVSFIHDEGGKGSRFFNTRYEAESYLGKSQV